MSPFTFQTRRFAGRCPAASFVFVAAREELAQRIPFLALIGKFIGRTRQLRNSAQTHRLMFRSEPAGEVTALYSLNSFPSGFGSSKTKFGVFISRCPTAAETIAPNVGRVNPARSDCLA
jgi:hypothetical protein